VRRKIGLQAAIECRLTLIGYTSLTNGASGSNGFSIFLVSNRVLCNKAGDMMLSEDSLPQLNSTGVMFS
jgi:hypothetical protein